MKFLVITIFLQLICSAAFGSADSSSDDSGDGKADSPSKRTPFLYKDNEVTVDYTLTTLAYSAKLNISAEQCPYGEGEGENDDEVEGSETDGSSSGNLLENNNSKTKAKIVETSEEDAANGQKYFDAFASSLNSCPKESKIEKTFDQRYADLLDHMDGQQEVVIKAVKKYGSKDTQTTTPMLAYWNGVSASSKLLHHMDIAAITLDEVEKWDKEHDKDERCNLDKKIKKDLLTAIKYWQQATRRYWQVALCYGNLHKDMSRPSMGKFEKNGVVLIDTTKPESYDESTGGGNGDAIDTPAKSEGEGGSPSAIRLSDYKTKKNAIGNNVSGGKFSMRESDYRDHLKENRIPKKYYREDSIWDQLTNRYVRYYPTFHPYKKD